MKSFIATALAGLVASIALFFFMALMIRPDGEFKRDRSDDQIVQFIRVRDDSRTEFRDRKPPEKPEEQQEKLPEPQMQVASNDAPDKPQLDFDTPKLNLALSDIGHGPGMAVGTGGGGAGGSGDSAPAPLVRIEPQYPRQAAMSGVEGWVRLRFDITPTGDVTNVEVVESEPRRVFDAAARAAVLRWKYRPQMVDGRPETLEGILVQLDFKLQD
jgi:periplasmic protein TonB